MKSSSGSVLVDKLNDLFIYLEDIQYHHNSQMNDNDPWSLAPFSSLGQDCFADVDHKEVSWEIRRIGTTYLLKDFISYPSAFEIQLLTNAYVRFPLYEVK